MIISNKWSFYIYTYVYRINTTLWIIIITSKWPPYNWKRMHNVRPYVYSWPCLMITCIVSYLKIMDGQESVINCNCYLLYQSRWARNAGGKTNYSRVSIVHRYIEKMEDHLMLCQLIFHQQMEIKLLFFQQRPWKKMPQLSTRIFTICDKQKYERKMLSPSVKPLGIYYWRNSWK